MKVLLLLLLSLVCLSTKNSCDSLNQRNCLSQPFCSWNFLNQQCHSKFSQDNIINASPQLNQLPIIIQQMNPNTNQNHQIQIPELDENQQRILVSNEVPDKSYGKINTPKKDYNQNLEKFKNYNPDELENDEGQENESNKCKNSNKSDKTVSSKSDYDEEDECTCSEISSKKCNSKSKSQECSNKKQKVKITLNKKKYSKNNKETCDQQYHQNECPQDECQQQPQDECQQNPQDECQQQPQDECQQYQQYECPQDECQQQPQDECQYNDNLQEPSYRKPIPQPNPKYAINEIPLDCPHIKKSLRTQNCNNINQKERVCDQKYGRKQNPCIKKHN